MKWMMRLSSIPPLICDKRQIFSGCVRFLGYDPLYHNEYSKKYIYGQIRHFHTTGRFFKMRKTREEKKNKNVITFKLKPKYPVVQLWPGVTIAEIAKYTNRKLHEVLEAMTYVDIDFHYKNSMEEIHDKWILQELAKKLGYRVDFRNPHVTTEKPQKKVELLRRPPPDPEKLVQRPPVVTIMGHVDHGKTTLLDTLRHTAVAAQEHGGITQHIGAFMVKVGKGRHITFLDTPGHAAFHAMRSRGARATDIVILVVAADDGIMEQTIESIRYAKEAGVPIIVAINKTDKPGVDIEQVKQQLLGCGLQVEEYGGDIQTVCISALKNINLDQLIEAILALAEMKEIKADVEGPVEAVVLETRVDIGKGKLSSALIQRGTLKKGSTLVSGTALAKVRDMFDEHGRKMLEATPGMPVQLSGWKSLPAAGDLILQAQSERQAHEVIKYREKVLQEEKSQQDIKEIEKKRAEHDSKYKEIRDDRLKRGRFRTERSYFKEKEIVFDSTPFLAVVIKGDVHGSLEAIMDVVGTYSDHEECRLDIAGSGVGPISENDIELAETFEGLIYSFCLEVPSKIRQLAEAKGIQIKEFNVIYHMIDDLRNEISGKLPLVRKDDLIGEAVVLEEFLINEGKRKIPIAGCRCTKGTLKRGNCKVIRNEAVIHDGMLITLKHGKVDVDSIKKDVECGIRVEDTAVNYLAGDRIVCYAEDYIPQTTKWNPGF